MEIYLIRHTRVKIEPGICYGHTNVSVADSFPAECEDVRSKLPRIENWAVYTSPLRRCQQLAKQFCADAIHTDPRLMELNFGDWEQQSWDAIETVHLHRWGSDFVNQRCPNGESFQDMATRVVACWKDVCQKNDSHVLMITHAGVIRALLSHLLDFPLHNAMQVIIDYGGVTKIRMLAYGPVIDYVNR